MFFDYEYFNGANILVELGDMVVTEAVAVSYSIEENKLPIYGYSSRHFDAIASGNVLVRGTLIINYVDADYMYYLLRLANNEPLELPIVVPPLQAPLDLDDSGSAITAEDLTSDSDLIKVLQNQVWTPDSGNLRTNIGQPARRNAIDRSDSIHLTITFGERSAENTFLGKTTLRLYDVYFTGRGSAIQIDENVIVESYSFIARDVGPIKKPIQITQTTVPE